MDIHSLPARFYLIMNQVSRHSYRKKQGFVDDVILTLIWWGEKFCLKRVLHREQRLSVFLNYGPHNPGLCCPRTSPGAWLPGLPELPQVPAITSVYKLTCGDSSHHKSSLFMPPVKKAILYIPPTATLSYAVLGRKRFWAWSQLLYISPGSAPHATKHQPYVC